MLKYVEEEWVQTETNLTQERGLWGPFNESRLTKWCLDMTEGPSRMRRRMMRNELFYLHYPHRETYDANGELKPHKYKRPTSFDSRSWYEQHHAISMFERDLDRTIEQEYDDCDVAITNSETKSLTIDEQMRKIGFSGLKKHPSVAQVSYEIDIIIETGLDIIKEMGSGLDWMQYFTCGVAVGGRGDSKSTYERPTAEVISL